MTVVGGDLLAATSILLAVCTVALLTLAAVCRVLLAQQKTQNYLDVGLRSSVGCTSEVKNTAESVCLKQSNDGDQTVSVNEFYNVDNSRYHQNDNGDGRTETEDAVVDDYNQEVVETTSSEPDSQRDATGNEEQTSWMMLQQTSYSGGGGSKIQRALSCDSVISDTSVGEMDYLDDVTNRVGQLEFSVQLKSLTSELIVTIIQARDLEPDRVTGSLDSYVKASLLPDPIIRNQTKVVRSTVCPYYGETFVYKVCADDFVSKSQSARTLHFQVYSCDKYARHRLLGETELCLVDVDLLPDQTLRLWLNLHEMDQKPVNKGSVMVSLNYLPTAERLILVVVKAQNLCWPSPRPVGDCCIKVYLLHSGKRIAKKKTSFKHEECNPIFNEAMIFSLSQSRIENVQLKISVIVLSPGDCRAISIGHVTLGPHSTGTELVHWTQIMTSFRRPVTMWHTLK